MRQKICMHKIIRHWWKKLRTTQTDGVIYHILGFEEIILWKWLHNQKQSTDSVQFLSNYKLIFHRKVKRKC